MATCLPHPPSPATSLIWNCYANELYRFESTFQTEFSSTASDFLLIRLHPLFWTPSEEAPSDDLGVQSLDLWNAVAFYFENRLLVREGWWFYFYSRTCAVLGFFLKEAVSFLFKAPDDFWCKCSHVCSPHQFHLQTLNFSLLPAKLLNFFE